MHTQLSICCCLLYPTFTVYASTGRCVCDFRIVQLQAGARRAGGWPRLLRAPYSPLEIATNYRRKSQPGFTRRLYRRDDEEFACQNICAGHRCGEERKQRTCAQAHAVSVPALVPQPEPSQDLRRERRPLSVQPFHPLLAPMRFILSWTENNATVKRQRKRDGTRGGRRGRRLLPFESAHRRKEVVPVVVPAHTYYSSRISASPPLTARRSLGEKKKRLRSRKRAEENPRNEKGIRCDTRCWGQPFLPPKREARLEKLAQDFALIMSHSFVGI